MITIREIVDVIEVMQNEDIVRLANNFLSCPFRNKLKHVFAMTDVLGMCNKATCQDLLITFLNTSCVEREMAINILSHLATLKLPSLFIIDMIDQLAFHPSHFPTQLQNDTLVNMAILALGSMSASLRAYNSDLSDKIVAKLHRMTLPHDHER